jgi:hypothetical protein
MAIALRAVGTWAAGTANQTFAIPTSPSTPQAGDMMLLFYGTKPYNDAPSINNSWAELGSATDGTTGAGIDVGSMRASIFWKIHTGTETNPTVTNTTNNVSGGVIIVFSKASTASWATIAHGGAGDATAGTDFSATTAGTISFAANDLVAAFAALRSDAATQSSIALTASGITFGAFTESPASDLVSASGGDIAASGGYAAVSSGSGTVALTYSSTLAAGHTGSFYAARLRELPAQDLTVPLLSNSSTLYAPTLAVGSVNITTPLLTNVSVLYEPTLVPQAVSTELPLFTNSSTLYAPTVTQSSPSQTTELPLFSNSSTLYAPTLVVGSVNTELPLFSNSSTLYSPTVTTGAVTTTLPLFSNSSTLYEPTVAPGSVNTTLPLLTNTSTLYEPTIATGAGGAQTLGLSFVDSTGNLYAPTVINSQPLEVPLFSNSSTLYAPTVELGGVSIGLPLFSNSQTFYSPELLPQSVSIQLPLLTNVNTLYAPTLSVGTGLKVWTSGGWVTATVYVYQNGWKGTLKVWNGAEWITLN